MSRRRRLLQRLLTARGRSLEITKAGWLFIVLTLGVGFAAINSGSNLLHVVFGAMMALIIGSGILSERAVARARARRVPAGPIHAQTPAAARVELSNARGRTDLLSLSVEDDDRAEALDRCAPVFAITVAAGQTLELPTTVVMRERGRHRLPPAVVSTRFPFGLFVKRRQLETPPEVLVYPKIDPVMVEPGHAARPGRGEQTGRPARAGEFYGLREYRDGDDPRRMHWPAVARTMRPVVREDEALGDSQVVLELARGKSGDPAFEAEVRRVASMAVGHLQGAGTAVALHYDGKEVIGPSTGPDGRHRILEFLATVGEEAPA